MKIIKLEQNTQEWLDWRKSGHSASEAPAVMGESKYFPKTPYQLYQVHTGQKEVFYSNAMRDGHKFEPVALGLASDELGIELAPVCAENGNMIASLDGFHESAERGRTVVEVKTTTKGSDLWENAEKIYKWQLVHQAIVAEVDEVVLAVYAKDTDDFKLETISISEEEKAELMAAWEKYYKCVSEFTPPPLDSKKDYAENDSEHWQILSSEYKYLTAEIKNMQNKIAAIKDELVHICDGVPTKGNGITVFPVNRKGNVNYKKIPELEGVDLDKYRGKSSSYWSIK